MIPHLPAMIDALNGRPSIYTFVPLITSSSLFAHPRHTHLHRTTTIAPPIELLQNFVHPPTASANNLYNPPSYNETEGEFFLDKKRQ